MTEPSHIVATRAAYDTVAVDYAALLDGALARMPMDRAMLGVFAELVRTSGGGRVADVGCGPGRITTYLDSLGLDAFGLDLSPAMVEVARSRYPQLSFDVGSLSALELPDGSLAGVVAWYSIIHTPPERLPQVFAELRRVLAPGGHLLLAFQAGDDEPAHRNQAYGHPVSLVSFRLSPDRVADRLGEAGFVLHSRVIREAEGEYEKTPQAYLLLRRPTADKPR
ncbi:MAG TPA: class I SAM-dependent methyltransferase [Nocardioidaceae bacterium]|nr:class I SAM-dependent methyltransferase [Nocardioidaceae bacterium]